VTIGLRDPDRMLVHAADTDALLMSWLPVTRDLIDQLERWNSDGASVLSCAQHFAIVLDGQIQSAPYIDFVRTHPQGA